MAQPQQPHQAPAEPAEAEMLRDLLKTLGVKQYDPRVLECLLDLTYRATSDILTDAEAINIAAGGAGAALNPQDVALAAAQHARLQPQPPSMQELLRLARRVNAQPLTGPSDKQHGIKLPPVADCLLSQNYQLRARPKAAGPPAAAAAAAAAAAPRQHYAVRQQPGKLGLTLPQAGWQPQADTAGGSAAEPFAPPAYAQQQQQGGGAVAAARQQGQQAMDVDHEEDI